MEFLSFDKTSKIWAPTTEELFYFCRTNRYVKQMNREFYDEEKRKMNPQNKHCHSPNTKFMLELYDGISIQTFLYTLTKKSNVTVLPDGRQQILISEGEANLLCGMMRREGFFEDTPDVPGCTVCATEKVEKVLMDNMQRQLDVTRLARGYYSLPENVNRFHVCASHRPFNPNDCIPNVETGGPQQDVNRTCYGPEVMSNVASNYGNIGPSTNLDYASNFSALDYIADQMGVKPQGTAGASAESEASLPRYLENLDLNSLFPNEFNNLDQLQYPTDSKFFPRVSNTRGISVSSDVSSNATSGFNHNFPKQSFDNGNRYVPSSFSAQPGAPNTIPAHTSGQNIYLNHPNVAMNGFQTGMPPINIQNNVEINLQNISTQANNNDCGHSTSNQGTFINPRMNPARQELITNTLRNLNIDMQDEVLRGNRIGRKIVGKRY